MHKIFTSRISVLRSPRGRIACAEGGTAPPYPTRRMPMYPDDIDLQSGCRLPLPRRDELGPEGRAIYDSLADPKGGTLRGLRGPGGITLHSEELARRSRPVNHYLRNEAGI